MRLAIIFAFCATPVLGWQFQSSPVCTLTQDAPEARVTVTFDARRPEPYAITMDRHVESWQNAPVFGMRFDGPAPNTITTDRHVVDGTRLTVTDRGFENVLLGLALNYVAVARLGDQSLLIPLDGAADKVEAFLACVATPTT